MNEAPPKLGSRRFREIAWLALIGDPANALIALYWFLTRRRLRGWSMLRVAASEAPREYRQWTERGELRAYANFRQSHPVGTSPPVVIPMLIEGLGDAEAAARTMTSIRVALGPKVPIYDLTDCLPECQKLPGGTVADAFAFLLQMHSGGWLLPVFSGDLIAPAIAEILSRVLDMRDIALAYWDEDQLCPEGRCAPWIKPDWDDLLFGRLGGLAGASVISLTAIAKGWRSVEQLSLDRAGIERLARSLAADAELPPAHIPLVLTHRAAADNRSGDQPKSEPFEKGAMPSISILIPTRDRPDLLSACLRGIDHTNYLGSLEIVIIDNGTVDRRALEIIEGRKSDPRFRILRDDRPFNFAQLNNAGALIASGELLCLLNNDVEPLDADWLTNMASYALAEGVGAVGAQLLYPSGRIQHAGVAIGIGGAAGHVQISAYPSDRQFWTWHAVSRQVSAVTAAVMVLRKSTFLDVGGFDEAAFPVAFNDVDLCLRLQRAGLRNIYAAEARLLHRESESRGLDRSPIHSERFKAELNRLKERWHTDDYVDPHFSPLFSRLTGRCVLAP